MSKSGNVSTRWWDDDAGPDVLDAWVSAVRKRDSSRLDALDHHYALYGAEPRSYLLRELFRTRVTESRLRFNLVASIVDTLQAQVCEQRPKASCLTDNGSWSQRRRSKNVERTIEGDFSATAFYTSVLPACVLDAEVTGTAALYGCGDSDGVLTLERVDPSDLMIDPVEARYGHVFTIARVKKMPRSAVYELWPDAPEGVIAHADAVKDDEFGAVKGADDLIEVIEAWRAQIGSKPGLYAVAARGGGYLAEPVEYTRTKPPFAFLRWRNRVSGFWGQGIAERVEGHQAEVNRTNKKIQKSMELSTGRLMVQRGSNVNKTQITNDPQDILEYDGNAPIPMAANLVPPELIQHRDRTIALAYEQEGVSQLSASSVKPAGLNSGEAQRVYLDNEAGRQLIPLRNVEQFVLDVAELCIDTHDELQDRGVEGHARATDSKWSKPLDWDDVRMDRKEYVMRIAASSALPRGSAGRAAMIDEWAQAGLLNREQWMYMRDIPDTDAFLEMELAPTNVVLAALESFSEGEDYRPPNPNQDLNLTMKLTSLAICRLEIERAPDDILEMFHTYFDDARSMLESAAQAQQPQAIATDPAQQQQAQPAPPMN